MSVDSKNEAKTANLAYFCKKLLKNSSQLIDLLQKTITSGPDPEVVVSISTSVQDFQPIVEVDGIKIEDERVRLLTSKIKLSDTGISEIKEEDLIHVMKIIQDRDREAVAEIFKDRWTDPWKKLDRVGVTIDEIRQAVGIDSRKLQYILILLCNRGEIEELKEGKYTLM